MRKSIRYQLITLLLLTSLHLIFRVFYPSLYAYFNMQNQAGIFVTIVSILRLLFLAVIAILGYFSLRHSKKTVYFFLALFLLNMLFPNFFH